MGHMSQLITNLWKKFCEKNKLLSQTPWISSNAIQRHVQKGPFSWWEKNRTWETAGKQDPAIATVDIQARLSSSVFPMGPIKMLQQVRLILISNHLPNAVFILLLSHTILPAPRHPQENLSFPVKVQENANQVSKHFMIIRVRQRWDLQKEE